VSRPVRKNARAAPRGAPLMRSVVQTTGRQRGENLKDGSSPTCVGKFTRARAGGDSGLAHRLAPTEWFSEPGPPLCLGGSGSGQAAVRTIFA